jgi:hypothetical protein
MKPTFQGEVQMRRWSDSSTQGVQITFALPDADDLAPLKAKVGKRFVAVLVEIGDDEQPVEPQVSKGRDQRGPLCKEACDLCAMPDFQKWCSAYDEALAKAYVLRNCGINSRKELDSDERAAERFREMRRDFLGWRRAK